MSPVRLLWRFMLPLLALQAIAARELLQLDVHDDTCVPVFGKCGGSFFNESSSCCDKSLCVVKNFWFAQCLTEEWAAIKVSQGWDGVVLEHEAMPLNVEGGPLGSVAAPLAVPDDTAEEIVFDCEDDQCLAEFDKCGGGYNVSSLCCDPGMECVVKNWYFAQCLDEERAVRNINEQGWDGRLLHCEEMPDDAPKGPVFWKHEHDGAMLDHAAVEEDPDHQDDEYIPPFSKFHDPEPSSPGTEPPAPAVVVLQSPDETPVSRPTAPEPPVFQTPEPVVSTPAPSDVPPVLNPVPAVPLSEPAVPEPTIPEPFVPEPIVAPPTVPVPPAEPQSIPVPRLVKPDPPSSDDFTFVGDLTYYGGAGVAGHCTQDYVPPGFTTVALNAPQYASGASCGTCLYACFDNLELGQGERCFEAIVDDECPECASGDLDLGENGSGRWPVDWKVIPCPPSLLMFSTQGSNPWYAKVKAQGGPSSVAAMTCNGMEGSLTPDAFFEFQSGTGEFACGMDCEVTFSNGFGTGSGNVPPESLGNLCT